MSSDFLKSDLEKNKYRAGLGYFVFFLPLISILPRIIGLVGVEISQPIADALTFAVSVPFLISFLRQLAKMEEA